VKSMGDPHAPLPGCAKEQGPEILERISAIFT